MNPNDVEMLRGWIGRSETSREVLSPVPAQCLAATLCLPAHSVPPGTLPPLWHWLHFPDRTPSDRLAADGSPTGNALRPPVPLSQVMWAGAELDFLGPLRTGVDTVRESKVADVSFKTGTRGDMVFVTWEHRYLQAGRCALVELNRGVFLGPSEGAARAHPARPAVREKPWRVDEAVLFRYSALTFNAHRIHYDLGYASGTGGYPALVVHGPLQAMLLAETFRAWHPELHVRRIVLRARAPLYLGGPVTVCAGEPDGASTPLWTRAAGGGPAMECVVTV